MSKLHPYPIRPAFEARLNRSGFSARDPDARLPIQHDLPAIVLSRSKPNQKSQADLLLADRTGKSASSRARGLSSLVPLGAVLLTPDELRAHDHHLESESVAVVDLPNKPELPDPTIWDWLIHIDLSDINWTLLTGAALLMTQTISILQRRRLVRALVHTVSIEQPDLFPETVEKSKTPAFHWQVDAATRQGQVRSENQDAVNTLRFEDGSVVMIVCDGAGGIGGGREASQSAVAAIARSLWKSWEENQALRPDDLETAIAAARQAARDKDLEGATTALVILLTEDQVHYATLGDGAVSVIWPDGMIGQVQVPHHTLGRPSNQINAYIGGTCDVPPRVGSQRLEHGAIIMAMSDGASDLFPFEEFAAQREKIDDLTGCADLLVARIEAAKDPDSGAWLHSDNMTLAMARLSLGGSDDQAH